MLALTLTLTLTTDPNPNPSPNPDQVTLEGLRSVDDLVQWRVRMQEVSGSNLYPCLHPPPSFSPAPTPLLLRVCQQAACAQLQAHWGVSPRGPKYTLVLDCKGMRPYHFGRASRAAMAPLTQLFTHYYPDFVGSTLVINAPGYLRATWSVVERLLPDWWGVRVGSLKDLGIDPDELA